MAQYSEGLKTGTLSSNVLLAEIPPDGGENPTGQAPQLWLSANVSATVEVQHRNAANDANIWAHRFFVGAAQPVVVVPPPSVIILETDERLRVVLITGIIGAVQATLLT
jgi:hypothetical protein